MRIRRLVGHYLSMALSLVDFFDGGALDNKGGKGYGRAIIMLLLAHVGNLATVLYLVLSPAQLHAVTYYVSIKNRIVLFVIGGLFGGPYMLWIFPALRKKSKEASENGDLALLVQKWRRVGLGYLLLSLFVASWAFGVAVSRIR